MEKFVGVLGILHLQNLHLQASLFQHGDGPLGGPLTGLVAVVDQDDLFGVPGQQGGVFLRQGGTKGCHGAVETVLVQGDGVHVALHQDQVRKFRFLRQIQGEQILPLVKNQGFRGVQVFGGIVVLFHDTAAEADDIAPDIDDGEHQAVPEPVKQVAVFLGNGHKAGVPQFLIGIALAPQVVHQTGPAVGGIADAELDDDGLGHAAAQRILQSRRTGGSCQLAVEETGGFLVECPEPLLMAVTGLVLLVLRHLHTGPLGQGTDGIGIAHAFHFHDEIHRAAALVTAEAVVNALIRCHGKGGGLLPVEGAEAKKIGTGTFQAHILAHHVLDGVTGHQFVQK